MWCAPLAHKSIVEVISFGVLYLSVEMYVGCFSLRAFVSSLTFTVIEAIIFRFFTMYIICLLN